MQLNPTMSPHVAVILLFAFAVVGVFVLCVHVLGRKK
jgi:hypothetical protein